MGESERRQSGVVQLSRADRLYLPPSASFTFPSFFFSGLRAEDEQECLMFPLMPQQNELAPRHLDQEMSYADEVVF